MSSEILCASMIFPYNMTTPNNYQNKERHFEGLVEVYHKHFTGGSLKAATKFVDNLL